MKRRDFLKGMGGLSCGVLAGQSCRDRRAAQSPAPPPNILFCIADDWGWPHAGALGDAVVRTPTFDRLADEGVLFSHAYVSSPSCTPSRNAVLTGQYHWRLGEGANLWSTLSMDIPVFPLLLESAGYFTGHWRKCWGPGDLSAGGYEDVYPGGRNFPDGFAQFLAARPAGQPFCFWLGSSDPHRPYVLGSGKEAGLDPEALRVPGFLPDVPEIRSDIADYYFEVERFDTDCGKALSLLEQSGDLENTIIVMTGDNGMPFPRCKSHLYDMGVRVPLAFRWGRRVPPGRGIDDFVSFVDFAPTFLEAAGLDIPAAMSGRSLLSLLVASQSVRTDPQRDHVIFGKERHVPAQRSPDMGGYPCRGIRTAESAYIRNFAPDRWPSGAPSGATHPIGRFADCDDSPTKTFLMEQGMLSKYSRFFDWCFGKRPAEELYDMISDPFQLNNLAGEERFARLKDELSARLIDRLTATGDPRITEKSPPFDDYPYRAGYALNLRGGIRRKS